MKTSICFYKNTIGGKSKKKAYEFLSWQFGAASKHLVEIDKTTLKNLVEIDKMRV